MIGPAQFNYSALEHTLQWLKGNDRPFAFLSSPGHIDHHCLGGRKEYITLRWVSIFSDVARRGRSFYSSSKKKFAQNHSYPHRLSSRLTSSL